MIGCFLSVQELVEKDYIAFQRGRHHTVHSTDSHGLPGEGETGCFSDVILTNILCQGKHIVDADAGGNFLYHVTGQRGQG